MAVQSKHKVQEQRVYAVKILEGEVLKKIQNKKMLLKASFHYAKSDAWYYVLSVSVIGCIIEAFKKLCFKMIM